MNKFVRSMICVALTLVLMLGMLAYMPKAEATDGPSCYSWISGWGYGNAPKTEEEFLTRLKGLTDVLLDNECMLGYCYTQLTDVEQEQNGLYTYDRRPKFPPEVIHPIFSRKAAIED